MKEYLRRLLPDDMEDFAGMRLPDDPDGDLPAERRYRLVVMASDISRHVLVRFPWDYRQYGLVPDEQSVVEAVRASMSIPFFFEPTYLDYERNDTTGKVHHDRCTLVDGGMLSNFPVDVFDRRDGKPPRWPTFGVRLSGQAGVTPQPASIGGPVGLTFAMLSTLIGWHDRSHVNDPDICERTIFVDTFGISAVSFDLSKSDQDRLYQSGRDAATKFLDNWDLKAHRAKRIEQAQGST